ncbi:MAG: hypothetical protein RR238_05230 [Lachnospiraceae bacterium]
MLKNILNKILVLVLTVCIVFTTSFYNPIDVVAQGKFDFAKWGALTLNYLAATGGCIFKGNFSQTLSCTTEYMNAVDKCYSDGNIVVDEATKKIIIKEPAVKEIKVVINNYIDSDKKMYTYRTKGVGDIAPSMFPNSGMYYSFISCLKKVNRIEDSSWDYNHNQQNLSNFDSLKYFIKEPVGFYANYDRIFGTGKGWDADFNNGDFEYCSIIPLDKDWNNTGEHRFLKTDIVDNKYINLSVDSNAPVYTLTDWRTLMNLSSLYSYTGYENITIFKSRGELINYLTGYSEVYRGKDRYTGGEVAVPTASTIDYDKMYDAVVNAINDANISGTNPSVNDVDKIVNDELDKILGQIEDNTGGTEDNTGQANTWLEKIKNVLDDILKTLKSIKHWTITDTVIDGANTVMEFLNKSTDREETSVSIAKVAKTKFPFCLAWDLVSMVSLFKYSADTAPIFTVPFQYPKLNIDYTFELDFSVFDKCIKVLKFFMLLFFMRGLIFATSKLIGKK